MNPLLTENFVTIDGFVIDCFISEELELAATITRYPVETGSKLTDHIVKEPRKVTVQGLVSDSPVGRVATKRAADSAVAGTLETLTLLPSEEALTVLSNIWAESKVVTVGTALKSYENMAMESLSVPIDATTGKALAFRATFVEIRLVTNRRTTIRTARPSGKAKQNLGHRGPLAILADALLGPPISTPFKPGGFLSNR